MLRIERALQTLNSWCEKTVDTIESIYIAEGDFKSPEKVNVPFRQLELPWFKTTEDERYFIKFDMVAPVKKDDCTYFIEISTGREGEWDAVNPQLLAYVNGEAICGLDVNHRAVFIRPEWHGKLMEIGMHLYTGMSKGDMRFRIKLIERSNSIFDAYYDLKIAKEALDVLPREGVEYEYVLKCLREAVYEMRLDCRESEGTKIATKKLSERLHKTLYGKETDLCGYTIHAVGHTHIDVAWLWDLRQTREKVARSFSTVMDMMTRYPDYKFMASQPVLYEMLEEDYPSIFNNIVKTHEAGKWETEGAMYLEADCNLIGGESMIRQIEMGQAYYKSKFNSTSKTLWLPDVFGYSAVLPQILKQFNIEMFITSKISWNDTNKLPYDSFLWRGIDGSAIPTQFITTTKMDVLEQGKFITRYEGNCHPSEMLGTIKRHQQRDIQPNAIMPFGYGDGGGGATETMLESAKRLSKGFPGLPKLKMSFVSDFIEAFNQTDVKQLPEWRGELYLEYHRGTYTTNAGMKQRHRRLEQALLNTEKLMAFSKATNLLKDTKEQALNQNELIEPWRTLLLNQFHDILPGTSIKRVYDEAYCQLDEAFKTVKNTIDTVGEHLFSGNSQQLTLFNPHGFEFSGTVCIEPSLLPEGSLKLNLVRGDERFEIVREEEGYKAHVAGLAPLSMTTFEIEKTDCVLNKPVEVLGGLTLETPYYSIQMDEQGRFTNIWDKRFEREIIGEEGFGNRLCLYEDRPLRWDAWDINEDYTKFELLFEGRPEIEVQEAALFKVIQVKRHFRNSEVTQRIYFYQNQPRIDFDTQVDWQEEQVLLRTYFDLNLNATEAKFDIQFGHVKRPIDRNHSYHSAMFEVCAAHWGDLSEDNYGVALMSGDKFGYSSEGATLGMSFLKSPTWPNEASDKGEHHFKYALLPHAGDATCGSVHHEALCFTEPIMAFSGAISSGRCDVSWIEGLPENLMIESFRTVSETTVQLRLVEHYNRRGKSKLTFLGNVKAVEKVKLSGEVLKSIDVESGTIVIDYTPFEIITLNINL